MSIDKEDLVVAMTKLWPDDRELGHMPSLERVDEEALKDICALDAKNVAEELWLNKDAHMDKVVGDFPEPLQDLIREHFSEAKLEQLMRIAFFAMQFHTGIVLGIQAGRDEAKRGETP